MLNHMSMYHNLSKRYTNYQLVRLRMNMENVLSDFAIYKDRVDPNDDIIDFVLTYTSSGLQGTIDEMKITDYLANLRQLGLSIRKVPSMLHPNMTFVLVSGSTKMLKRYANIRGIELSCDNPYYEKEKCGMKAFACRVMTIAVDDPEFSRAPDTYSGERPRGITTSERIMVVFHMLRDTRYGPDPTQHGILRLLEKGVFTTAYPLHEPEVEWTEEGPLYDRQILARYWANSGCFLKRQPLNLIEKYFGAEVGFYFAFLKHLILTLWFAAAVGTLCFIYGLLTITTPVNLLSYQICSSDIVICPACTNFKICKYKQLKISCTYSYINYILDNQVTICYAVLVSLWTTIAMELWKRNQAALAYKWNVFSAHTDVSIRPEYAIAARLTRKSRVTGEWEPYEDAKHKYWHMFISYSVVILLAVAAISVVIAIRFYVSIIRAVLSLSDEAVVKRSAAIIATSSASTLSVIMMLILEKFYVRLAKVLTNLENPRTEVQYENSLIYKRFILTFINGYAVTCYIAFFHGRFYTYPGVQHSYRTQIQYDLCDPSGCTVNLAIHLAIVLTIKAFLMNAVQGLAPVIVHWVRKKRHSKKLEEIENLPVWEQQYNLPALDRFFLVEEFNEIALQYGFVAFFSTSFTLAPIFALMHALISVRVDGQKFIKSMRRPVPVRVSGLSAWEGIFKMITLIGVVMNAFIVGATMDFIPREIYNYWDNKTGSFIQSGLSIFDTNDFADKQNMSHPKLCYYKGKRHPPSHPAKYTVTKDHWYELAMRIAFVIIYEQVVFTVTSILAYAIPDIPRSIKEKIEFEKTKLLKKNLANL